ncbi:ribosome recycling factor [Brevibacillus laterosporus]|uniref:Ribosome-recycling factor n=1 Tax=Brevibacillus laterosporus LMG 15441 TaxID=1042163 RepID=A0A075R851_BRELA|nr:ribosome recycling factor [Brevibacillus laterosporus]HAS00774.1 ribosome recycling factor [Brevibacillus sp.]AIG27581.1 ribosome-releasing factor Frr [Brevibacillus laterosporus LMG 15441]ERM19520.1 ribosome recycling factor [Brevibacillus laterosporus PE36]RJL15485.1 ribosome recycling factor [Brevibacillus laterosporus]TPH06351.1 ribosome recycling factor [Brevibacillus laterosporus]
MPQNILKDMEDRMSKAIQTLKKDLATLRAGRATPAMLDKIMVDYYGTPTPINQLANVVAPEPRMLQVQPWDKNALKDIDKAIMQSDIGLTPTNDGSVIRIAVPPLTEERRRDLVKVANKNGEDAKVAIRNVRRDANDGIKKLEKAASISEDESRGHQETVQKTTDKFIAEVDKIVKDKEKDILEV